MKLKTLTLLGLIATTVLDFSLSKYLKEDSLNSRDYGYHDSTLSNDFDDYPSISSDNGYEDSTLSNDLDDYPSILRDMGYEDFSRSNNFDKDSLISKDNEYEDFRRSNDFDKDTLIPSDNGYGDFSRSKNFDEDSLHSRDNGYADFSRSNYIDVDSLISRDNGYEDFSRSNYIDVDSLISRDNGYEDVDGELEDARDIRYEDDPPNLSTILFDKFSVSRSNVIHKFETLPKTYTISFDLVLNNIIVGQLVNVLHFTTGNNYLPTGSRIPALYFYGDSLYIYTDINAGHRRLRRKRFPLKQSVTIEISYKMDGSDYVFIYNDGEKTYKEVNKSPQKFTNVKLYASDKWYKPFDGEIRNLKVGLGFPVDGGYSDWSSYSECSVSCGGGTQSRNRTCTNPAPAYEGQDCSLLGESLETKNCNTKPCPVDGGYSMWSNYSECSASCGGGIRTRERNCTNPTPALGGSDCSKLGNSSETASCNPDPCPVDGGYSLWSNYSECSASCGGGIKTRERNCNNPIPDYGGKDCSGNSSETTSCNPQPCPVDGGYSLWSNYSECSASCGGGIKTRERNCNNPPPAHGGNNCSKLGNSSETASCNLQPCPVDGGYSSWSNYGECSCGEVGIKTRERSCNNPHPANGGKDCSKLGNSSETASCNPDPCPVDGGYSMWSNYSECSASCGGGIKTRERNCNNPIPDHGGKDCSGNSSETTSCNPQPCPESKEGVKDFSPLKDLDEDYQTSRDNGHEDLSRSNDFDVDYVTSRNYGYGVHKCDIDNGGCEDQCDRTGKTAICICTAEGTVLGKDGKSCIRDLSRPNDFDLDYVTSRYYNGYEDLSRSNDFDEDYVSSRYNGYKDLSRSNDFDEDYVSSRYNRYKDWGRSNDFDEDY